MYNLLVCIPVYTGMDTGISTYTCTCPNMYPEVPGDMQMNESLRVFLNAIYQFYLRMLSCMSVCCDITVGNGSDTGDTSNSVPSTGQYFVSRAVAN